MNDDLISRKMAIDAMSESLKRVFPEHRQIAEKCLNALPSAQPERKKGEWIPEDDLISRKAAIDAVAELASSMSVCISVDECHGMKRMQNMAVIVLDDLPSAQPQRMKGHWIEAALSNHTYKCSVCGRFLVNIVDGKNNVAKDYPYCHCGADMRGDDNG